MSEHIATVSWKRTTADFAYETYDRSHQIQFGGGLKLQGSSAPEFLGKKELANPEEMLAAALGSCHMLTFLAVAARSKLVVDSYEDRPTATLAKSEKGVLCVTEIHLKPKVTFSGSTPTPERVKELHEKAHRNCFVANSLACKMSIEPA